MLNDRLPLGVEAAALSLSELSLDTPFTRSGNNTYSTFANLTRNGGRLAIKLRNAPVTVSPHHDTFNNFTMDVKLPDDFQGSNLKNLEEAISSGGANWPAVASLIGRLNGEFTFKSRLYGMSSFFISCAFLPYLCSLLGTGENTFLSLKLQENLKVTRKGTDGSINSSSPDAIIRGMEVDLAIMPLIWVSETEDGTTTAGVTYKAVKVQIIDGVPAAGSGAEDIEIDL